MDRRHLLKLMAASSLLGSHQLANANAPLKVGVVGGGIMGNSIAYHLSRAGADVTLLERSELATQASRGTFAWINATWAKQPRHYHTLNRAGVQGWHRLQQELGVPVKWGGSLEWFADTDRQAKLRDQIDEQIAWGEPAEMVSPEALSAMEPAVDFSGTPDAAYSANDGAVDPVLTATMMAEASRAMGSRIVTGCEVLSAEPSTAGLNIKTSCGDFSFDRLVLATGADPKAMRNLASADIPQRSRPGVITVTKPMSPLMNRIIAAPGAHMHQRLDGRILLGEQEGAPQNEAHAKRLENRPNRFPDPSFADMHARRTLDIATQYIPGLAKAEVEEVYIGWRPLPLDGHPVVGFSPAKSNVYLAVTHSGVTLSPIIGELAAQEIMGNTQDELLAPYRPDRTFEHVKRY